jgi:hypothetical protein
MKLLTNTLKLRSLQNALSSKNNYADQPCTPCRKAHQDRQERREFSGSGQFRQSLRSCSPHCIGTSKPFSRHRASPPPYYQLTSSSHSPSKISAKSANAVQKTSGMALKPGVEKMIRGDLSFQPAPFCAMTGTHAEVVPQPFMVNDTSVLDAEKRMMELRTVLELRKRTPLTPYKVESWDKLLHRYHLSSKYPRLIASLQKGFNVGIRRIYKTFTPPNGPSLVVHNEAYQEIVSGELFTLECS